MRRGLAGASCVRGAALIALAACALLSAAPARAANNDAALERRLSGIASGAPGVCGISVMNLDTGRRASVRADERFPLASTFKLPLAMTVLAGVDQGAVRLEEKIHLNAWDMNPAASALTDAHPLGGVDVAIHDLLDAMLLTSDNTAADVLLRRVGGPAIVTAALRDWGVSELRVDRSETQMGNDWYGLEVAAADSLGRPDTTLTAASLKAAREAVPASKRGPADQAYARDPRDTGTPRAYTALLTLLWRGAILSPASTDTIVAMMSRCTTGAKRLRAGLPAQVKLAHRTGTGYTWNGHTFVVNDLGVITLPGGGGRVAIAVMIRDVRGPVENAEKVMASVARAVFDAWNAPE
jgi:beta-lactamase class A